MPEHASNIEEFTEEMAPPAVAIDKATVPIGASPTERPDLRKPSANAGHLYPQIALVGSILDERGDTSELPRTGPCIHLPSPAAIKAITAGSVLRERYVIQHQLGAGGKGTVFKALDRYRASLPKTQQYVGLKVLHACGECFERTMVDLQQDLHWAQVLSHPNIVNVFELDRDENVVFFTMELLQGESLRSLLERMRPTAMRKIQAWQLIRQLGAGLAHAHKRGVIHGDLKPGNIFVTREGELRILDFGAAQPFANEGSHSGASPARRASVTPAYASCEQLEGRSADPRDDLYALACVSYEVLTGAHPFASRPANLARDAGVRPTRPVGITNRQWKTLQAGLSWYRVNRSSSVRDWIRGLLDQSVEVEGVTPLHEFARTTEAQSNRSLSAGGIVCGVLIAVLICVALSRVTLSPKSFRAVRSTAPAEPKVREPITVPVPDIMAAFDPGMLEAASSPTVDTARRHVLGVAAAKPAARLDFSIRYETVKPDVRFVELMVNRNEHRAANAFTWWTESATAKQDVDYVRQAPAVQGFATDRVARIYVKLLPDARRMDRKYFFVAVADPAAAVAVTRTLVWLPKR